jgi:hypothetical protein
MNAFEMADRLYHLFNRCRTQKERNFTTAALLVGAMHAKNAYEAQIERKEMSEEE